MFDHVEIFHRPRSIPEAIRLLHAGGSQARLVAGGTDVVVEGDRTIRWLVDITRLGLNYVRRNGNSWNIGATATLAALEESAIRGLADGILARAAAACGSVQLRNMATVGGNLANASPAADMATPLLVLDASVVLAGPRGRRRSMPLADLFRGSGQTALGKALLVEIVVPLPPRGHTGWSFQKLGRTETDISLVNAAAGLQLDAKGRCRWARIALGAVAPTPLRMTGAESELAGQKPDLGLIEKVCDRVAREVSPITDLRASAEYRRDMSRVLTRRALMECARLAGGAL